VGGAWLDVNNDGLLDLFVVNYLAWDINTAGYASSSAGPVHFGLGQAKSADLVEIRWPSGIVRELKSVSADRLVKVKEPAR